MAHYLQCVFNYLNFLENVTLLFFMTFHESFKFL